MPKCPHIPITIPVRDSVRARAFEDRILKCQEDRPADEEVDFDLFGYEIAAQLSHEIGPTQDKIQRHDAQISMRHFGVTAAMQAWNKLAENRATSLWEDGRNVRIRPRVRLAGNLMAAAR